MKTIRYMLLAFAAVTMFSMGGCTRNPEAPAVNDENCKPENIAKIKDENTRSEFAAKCEVHGSGFKPSPIKKW